MENCGLGPTKHISTDKQLAIFLRVVVTGLGNQEHQERFQRSRETISVAFHRILDMLVSNAFYRQFVKLPDPDTVQPEILENPRFFPFFKDCKACVGGSLHDAWVPADDQTRYRSHKGRISNNLLIGCQSDLQFCYMLSGWEGSAADLQMPGQLTFAFRLENTI